MNPRFKAEVFNNVITKCDWVGIKGYLTSKNGTYQLVISKWVDFGPAQMRKFFHGPVLEHFQSEYKELGWGDIGKEDIRRYLKAKYLGYDKTEPFYKGMLLIEKYKNEPFISPSTATIKAFLEMEETCAKVGVIPPLISLSTFENNPEKYLVFLNNLDGLSKERFKVGLPSAENVE